MTHQLATCRCRDCSYCGSKDHHKINDSRCKQQVHAIEEEDNGDNDDDEPLNPYGDNDDVYETQEYHLTGTEATYEELDMGEYHEDQDEH